MQDEQKYYPGTNQKKRSGVTLDFSVCEYLDNLDGGRVPSIYVNYLINELIQRPVEDQKDIWLEIMPKHNDEKKLPRTLLIDPDEKKWLVSQVANMKEAFPAEKTKFNLSSLLNQIIKNAKEKENS